MLKYEYVYENNLKLYARLFNSETNKSELKIYDRNEYTPSLYIPSTDGEYTSFTNQQTLREKTFPQVKDMYDYIKGMQVTNIPIYGNKSVVQKYIRDEFSNGTENDHTMRTWFWDIETRTLQGFPDYKNPVEPITLIQIYDTFDKEFYILGYRDYINDLHSDLGKINYIQYPDEKTMLKGFVQLTQEKDPTIFVGFNTYVFDHPYLTERMKKVGVNPEQLSPIRVVTKKEGAKVDMFEYTHYDWMGRYLLDYRNLYLKYSFRKLPRYNLETIAMAELGEGKVSHDEHFSFEEFYQNDYKKYVDYGIRDVEILVNLDRQVKMIDTTKYIAYNCGVNLTDVFGTYKQWHSLVYNEMIARKSVLPLEAQYVSDQDVYVGGWVKSTPGKHDWIVSFDFASLYPSIIRFINIGVDTLIKPEELPEELLQLKEKFFSSHYIKANEVKIKEINDNPDEFWYFKNIIDNREEINQVLVKYDVCASPNGFFYRRANKSILSELMERFYNQRVEEKGKIKKYTALADTEKDDSKKLEYLSLADTSELIQYVQKILINSCYGAMALEINPFSHGKGAAAAVTSASRMSNRWVNYYVGVNVDKLLGLSTPNMERCPYTIQADTDSGYFNLLKIMNKKFNGSVIPVQDGIDTCNNIINKILVPFIDEALDQVAFALNARHREVLDMEQETIADKFVSVADKRYYCRYYKKNKKTGELESHHKITGLSLISKSTPPFCKEKLQPVLDMILDRDVNELINYIDDVKKEFIHAPVESISPTKGVSSIDYPLPGYRKFNGEKYLTAPLHSRGALIHNTAITKLESRYEPIRDGDKVFTTYLTKPNKEALNENVISFINPKFMEDSKIYKYIDYDIMFEKNFLKNIELITAPIGWSLNKYQALMDDWE